MSYHRVLPRPLPLSNEDLATRWTMGQDSLRSKSVTTAENHVTGHSPDNSLVSTSKSRFEAAQTPASTFNQEHSSPSRAEVPKADGDKHDMPAAANRSSASSTSETWEGDVPGPICLCQPDPKVPRPRNAFILYRQHHQASIVAQNPGLPNPEISKVIGDLWRASPPDVKEHWKSLAEEEKIRHQNRYPDYRYQPRRAGRTGSTADAAHGSIPSPIEATRCGKCGGRSISGSLMIGPNASGQGSPGVNPLLMRDQRVSMAPPSTPSAAVAARFMREPASPAPRDGPTHSSRHAYPQVGHSLPLASPRHIKRPVDLLSPSSPESKRRRLPTMGYGHSRTSSGQHTPVVPTHHQPRRGSMAFPEVPLSASSSPTSFNRPPGLVHDSTRRRGDPLRLPPLHTPSSNLNRSRSDSDDTSGVKTLEAMIHSIPLLGKIRLLGKVAGPPPLIASADSPEIVEGRKSRGPIICIDAADPETIAVITDVLKRNLQAECNVKVFSLTGLAKGEEVTMQAYLRLIYRYHELSREVTAHVTSAGMVSEKDPDLIRAARKMSTVSRQLSEVDLKTDPTEDSPEKSRGAHDSSDQEVKTNPEVADTVDVVETTGNDGRLPIALLPGWHLTQTDHFAINVPIVDSYSPVDHWQWHLTFWRGIIGADVTVAVQPAGADEANKSPPITAVSRNSAGLGPAGSTPDSARPENKNDSSTSGVKRSSTGIDIHLDDARAIILQAGEKGAVVESALRRAGFEVGEWIRGWNEREHV